MKKNSFKSVFTVLAGALLLGLLWRARGTNGWGSSWGLLNAGFVFALFLNFAVDRKRCMSLPLITVAGFSFMLTCPAWGTFLTQITGILSVSAKDTEPVLYDINPISGILIMLLLGFGLASVYGVVIGRGFSDKQWRLRDYITVLITFILVDLIAKATLSHLILRMIEPQAVTAFNDGLAGAGITDGAYKTYITHFSSASWAKGIVGGRNYFSYVGTISLALAAVFVLLSTRFIVKDRFAAKTGAVVCSAFAVSITVADIFFFFGNGGYKMSQGFSLPDNFAAWSLWEYFTGFIAGAIITAYLMRFAPKEPAGESVLSKLPEKPVKVFTLLLCVVGGIGLNTVRPLMIRIENTVVMVIAVVLCVLSILLISYLYFRKNNSVSEDVQIKKLSPCLCLFFTLYVFIVYMFIGKPEITGIKMLHNILFTVSAILTSCFCASRIKKSFWVEKNEDQTL